MSESMSLQPRGGNDVSHGGSVACERCGEMTPLETKDQHFYSKHFRTDEAQAGAQQTLKEWDADPTREPGYGRATYKAHGAI